MEVAKGLNGADSDGSTTSLHRTGPSLSVIRWGTLSVALTSTAHGDPSIVGKSHVFIAQHTL